MGRRRQCGSIIRSSAKDIALHCLKIPFSANEQVKNFELAAPRNGSMIWGFFFLSQSPKSGSRRRHVLRVLFSLSLALLFLYLLLFLLYPVGFLNNMLA
ncbi:hypothetical protein CC77DRAFT_311236 [Alternaria alternata]|uniref:Uncharacterized protein n=1 Tax=Alternaria alternata TaxID=5599 RepID=A0A177E213_ALTAL|nr:hypothetical protein CC77DRAFT_311236 [Alternaria alternata]OAG25292.1 hypothetical protein CC77DRAFT_311236 [Alternaria alternata]